MDESLEKALLEMGARDQALRAELTAAGELDERYHPRLEELHRAHASRLRQIIAVFGWPGVSLVGEKGAQAAWKIALHSISEPEFMRQCRTHIDTASQHGDAPRWQHEGSSEPTDEVMTDGGFVNLETAFPPGTVQKLLIRGHDLRFDLGGYGGYQAIMWDAKNRVYAAASESRKDGMAAGY